MPDLYRPRALAKLLGQPLDHIDRPVSATRAAKCHREITAVNDVEVLYPETDKGFQLRGHLVDQISPL